MASVRPPEDRLRAAALELLAVLARSEGRDASAAARAFALGCRELGLPAVMPPPRTPPFDGFHRALRVLRAAQAGQRRRVVGAAAQTVAQDGVLDPTEAALVRLVADALDAPLPLVGDRPPPAA
jgi:hypothetical protein